MLSDSEIIKRFSKAQKSLDGSGYPDWLQKEVVDHYKFIAGDQWDPSAKSALESASRVPIVYNRSEPLVNQVAGFMVQNRRSPKYFPTEPTDRAYADLLTDMYNAQEDQGDYEDHDAYAFWDNLICGLGVEEEFIDYDRNPDGEIGLRRVFPGRVAWDQSAQEKDLSDARWMRCLVPVDDEELEEMHPGALEKIKGDVTSADYEGTDNVRQNSRDVFDPDAAEYGFENQNVEGKHALYDYQWFQRERRYRVNNPLTKMKGYELNPETGQPYVDEQGQPVVSIEARAMAQVMEELGMSTDGTLYTLDHDDFTVLSEAAEAVGVELDYSESKTRVYYRAHIVGGHVLMKEKCPVPDAFTYRFMTGRYDQSRKCFYGMVRALVDPQRMANSSFLKMYEAVNSSPRGGVLAESSVTDNHAQFEDSYAMSDAVTWVKDGALAQGKIEPKAVPGLQTGFEKPLEFSVMSFRDVTGINIEFLGQADKNMPGVLADQRLNQAVTAIAHSVAAYHLLIKNRARAFIHWLRILSDNVEGRFVRRMGEKGVELQELNKDELKGSYDVDIGSVPMSDSQQMEQFQTLISMLQYVPQEVVGPFMMMILENSPLATDALAEIKKLLQQATAVDPQAMQLQNVNTKLELERKQLENEKLRRDITEKATEAIKNVADAQHSAAKADNLDHDRAVQAVETMMRSQTPAFLGNLIQ